MTSLTVLYVEQVVRRLPEASRPDIARELSAMLADMVEARLADDPAVQDPESADLETRRTAERAVVAELGDPARLARQYRESPGYLIGPDLFPVFLRLMRLFLPLVALLSGLVGAIDYWLTAASPAIGQMIGETVGSVVGGLMWAFAVAVIVFAVIERTVPPEERAKAAGMSRATGEPWTPEELESEVPTAPSRRGDAIASLVFYGILALLPIVPSSFFYAGHLNEARPFVNQALWDFWLPAFYVLLALGVTTRIWLLVRRRWTTPLFVVEIVLDLVTAVFLTALVMTQQVADPFLVETVREQVGRVDGVETGTLVIVPLVVVGIWAITLWDQIDTYRAWRHDRALTD
jgi:hypothetical protein